MESPATRGTDRRADTAAALYELAAYRELFMRDQIDWFGDNIEVAHCSRLPLGRRARDARPHRRLCTSHLLNLILVEIIFIYK